MRLSIAKIATLAMAVPIAGATFLAAAPAASAAPAKSTVKSAATASDAFSAFKIHHVKGTTKIKPGGTVTYSFSATNLGPFEADAYYTTGILPKGVDTKKKIRFAGPKGTECEVFGRVFFCWGPYILDIGDTDWLTVKFAMKKTARGTLVGKVGVLSYDLPHGAEDLDRKALDALGIKNHLYLKTIKTKVVR